MVTQIVTNEDILEAIRDLDTRMKYVERCAQDASSSTNKIQFKQIQHDIQFLQLRHLAQELTDKHSAYINDIADILDRITALEKQMPYATKEELYELQVLLQKMVDWAIKAAKTVKVPLELP